MYFPIFGLLLPIKDLLCLLTFLITQMLIFPLFIKHHEGNGHYLALFIKESNWYRLLGKCIILCIWYFSDTNLHFSTILNEFWTETIVFFLRNELTSMLLSFCCTLIFQLLFFETGRWIWFGYDIHHWKYNCYGISGWWY